jgi:hypothetical protein
MDEREHDRDVMLDCVGCRCQFMWSAGEQGRYRKRGYQQPRRCQPCREARTERQTRGRPLPNYRMR